MKFARRVRVPLLVFACFTLVLLASFIQHPTAAQQQNAAPPAAAATAQPTPPPGGQPSGGLDDENILINSDLVTVTVTVQDGFGRFVSGLDRSAFSLTDEKVPQEITFFSDEDAPVSLGIVFDVSGSMSGDKINRAREALARFVETSHERDEYFLIGFNDRAQLLLDRTRDSNALLSKLTFVQTKGQTALYDACYLGVEKVTRGAHRKRALIIISDGQDNNSRYTFTEVRRLLKESDVIIYSVGILDQGANSDSMAGEAILTELSGVSGGKYFPVQTNAEMSDIFERIALELRHQYSIGYRPSNFTADGKWHRLKVKVTPPRGLPRLYVRSREGYYATVNRR